MSAGLEGKDIIHYLCLMGTGFAISIVGGACIGVLAKNQMGATSLVMPVMMVLAFAPMLATFNASIAKFAGIFYTQQIKLCLDTLSPGSIAQKSFFIIMANVVVLLVLFEVAYRRKGLE